MKKLLLLSLSIFVLLITTGCSALLNDNIYKIKQNGKIGFIDKNGKEIVEAKFENAILNNEENLVAVKHNGLWGFMDKKGQFVVVPQYKETDGFKDGLAFVSDDNFEGYINHKGNYVWKQAVIKKQKSSSSTAKPVSHVKNDLADSIFKEIGL